MRAPSSGPRLPGHGRYDYSAITQRPDYSWPNGARLAVYIAVGVEEYAFGEGLTEDLLPGASRPDLVNTAWRDYGNRVGAFRLFDWLATIGASPAMLLNTAVCDHAPAVIEAARGRRRIHRPRHQQLAQPRDDESAGRSGLYCRRLQPD